MPLCYFRFSALTGFSQSAVKGRFPLHIGSSWVHPASQMKASTKVPSAPAVTAPISQLQLAELACQLHPHDGESAEQMVRRAMSIWNASGKLLAEDTGAAEAKPSMTFDELAGGGLVPSIREKTQVVGTGKGVASAVRRFFDAVLAGYDPAMKGRLLTVEKQRENKAALKKLCEDVLQQGALSASLLTLVQQFQNAARERNDIAITPELIRNLLMGADVGRHGFNL
jgi:hypothetical protein